ncbi:MAG: SDR family NAD(P)-dependent oxidoreductase [Roseiarcus sp.]
MKEIEARPDTSLATRTFDMADQNRFAAVSGDRNPMHLDAVAARRTPGGAPVVHGVHLLLWALDVLARGDAGKKPVRRLTARFKRFVAIDEAVAMALTKRTEASAWLDLAVSGLSAAQIAVDFGAPASVADTPSGDPISAPATPHDLTFEQMDGLSGRLAFAAPPEAVAAMFPAASDWLGPRRLAALAASTLMVGMVCPGLHSMFSSLTVDACDEPAPQDDHLGFRVTRTDPRFRMVRMSVAGGGWTGVVESFARLPPVPQAPSRALVGVVGPVEFAGCLALVVGGSRGLGEVTAKLLAAGGAKVVITYRVGASEAEAVATDIRAAGGSCDTLAYDASEPAEAQLAKLDAAPTHAYYFATPAIFKAQSALFARERLDAFLGVYVDGFYDLAQALRARRSDVSLFYPSSVYVTERPRGMIEYAMAKAAGETLCAEMNVAWAPMHVTVERLPRLLTDQTASVTETKLASPISCLTPVVREAQSWPRPAT